LLRGRNRSRGTGAKGKRRAADRSAASLERQPQKKPARDTSRSADKLARRRWQGTRDQDIPNGRQAGDVATTNDGRPVIRRLSPSADHQTRGASLLQLTRQRDAGRDRTASGGARSALRERGRRPDKPSASPDTARSGKPRTPAENVPTVAKKVGWTPPTEQAPANPDSTDAALASWAKAAPPDAIRQRIQELRDQPADRARADEQIRVLEIETRERDAQGTADLAAQTSPDELRARVAELREVTTRSSDPRAERDLEIIQREAAHRDERAAEDHAHDMPLDRLRSEINATQQELERSCSAIRDRALAILEDVAWKRQQQDPIEWAEQQRAELRAWQASSRGSRLVFPDISLRESWASHLYRHGASLDALAALARRLEIPDDPGSAASRSAAHREHNRFYRQLNELEGHLFTRWAHRARGMELVELVAAREEVVSRLAAQERYFDRREDVIKEEIYNKELAARATASVNRWSAHLSLGALGEEVQRLEDQAAREPTADHRALSTAAAVALRERVLGEIQPVAAEMPSEQLNREIEVLREQTALSPLDRERLAVYSIVSADRQLAADTQRHWERYGAEIDSRQLRIAKGPYGVTIATRAQLERAAHQAYVRGALDAHTGLIFGSIAMALTDDPGLAAMVNGLFDAAGQTAMSRNAHRAATHQERRTISFEEAGARRGGDIERVLDRRAGPRADDTTARSRPDHPLEPFSVTGPRAAGETPHDRRLAPARAPVDWHALRTRAAESTTRRDNAGLRFSTAREGNHSVVLIEGAEGRSVPRSEGSATDGDRRGDKITGPTGLRPSPNHGMPAFGSSRANVDIAEMKSFEVAVRRMTDTAAAYGARVETRTALLIEHRTTAGRERQVLVGVLREAGVVVPALGMTIPFASAQARIDPITGPPRNRRLPGTTLPPGPGRLTPGSSPLGEGDIDSVSSGSGKKGSRVGDQLQMHEPWQNSDLVARMVAPRRGVGAQRHNPAVALPDALHTQVTREQRKLGLFDKAARSAMSARQVIDLNATAMRNAGVPREVVQESRKEALRFAAKQGELSAAELADIATAERWNRTLDIDL
jgi:hypothetical protein